MDYGCAVILEAGGRPVNTIWKVTFRLFRTDKKL